MHLNKVTWFEFVFEFDDLEIRQKFDNKNLVIKFAIKFGIKFKTIKSQN